MALSTVQAIAGATQVLEAGGYQTVATPKDWPSGSRIFEDLYGIVGLHVYETWTDLADDWPRAQGLLVDLMSAHVQRGEPKSWEGYLVLFALGPLNEDDQEELVRLRYDTNRVRKLVAAADDLESLAGVETALLPLLPLTVEASDSASDALLSRLPELLEAEGVDPAVTREAVDAFAKNESVLQRIHKMRART